MLTKEQEQLLTKQLKAGTAPQIAGAMLGAKTMQELEANKELAYKYAKDNGLLRKVDMKEEGDT